MKEINLPMPGGTPGSQRVLQAWEFGSSGPLAYLQAGLHADELPGVLALHRLRQHLMALEQQGALLGRIRLVPQANPIGLSQWHLGLHQGRFLAATGQNFNRGYPLLVAKGEAIPTHLTARDLLLARLAEQRPRGELAWLQHTLFGWALEADLVLDIHCDSDALLHLYGHVRQRSQVERLGACLGAGVMLLSEQAGGMSFDDALLQNWYALMEGPQVPVAVTVELRGQQDVADHLAEQDARRLLACLQERGWIDPDFSAPVDHFAAIEGVVTPLSAVEVIPAPAAGILSYEVAPGDRVLAGQRVGWLTDAQTGERIALTAHHEGLCYARVLNRLACTGDEVIFLAGEVAHREGDLLGL
ncbi:succinylglutamate desuccinylase/aspartoacylase family protein [Aeromonas enteropelogenes]|uniref:succinylglutamate desuccinylase/aspartoacylase domain-containing protein n=1 Tax=Aeromonas enteropelogenes TaxID=29489 RepID=UPI003134C0D6